MERATSFEVTNRPFSIDRFTNVMLPDGIFDSALHFLDIGFYVTNIQSYKIEKIWIEPLYDVDGADWSYYGGNSIEISDLPPKASYLVRWRANFRNSTPGKKNLGIKYKALISSGWSYGDNVVLGITEEGEIRKEIFVSRTTYDVSTKKYTCEVPEGELRLSFEKRSYFPPIKANKYADGTGKQIVFPPIPFPRKIDGLVISKPGSGDLLPFNDPWWKVVAWIIAVVAAIAALIAAKEGKGTASLGISGEGQDDITDYDLCIPDTSAHPDAENIAGYLSVVASTAMRVGMADAKDPWQKGREYFSSQLDMNARIAERVVAEIQPPNKLTVGTKFSIPIDWVYEAISTNVSEQYRLEKREIGENEHLLMNLEIEHSKNASPYDTIWVRIRLQGIDGIELRGVDVFGHVVFIPPGESINPIRVPILDYNPRTGEKLSLSLFWAELNLEKLSGKYSAEDTLGVWKAIIYVQNTNSAKPEMHPIQAATYVGGNFLVGPKEIVFPDPPKSDDTVEPEKNQCPSDSEIEIVVNLID